MPVKKLDEDTHERMLQYVEELKSRPREYLHDVWTQGVDPDVDDPTALFARIAPDCGCLTQVRDEAEQAGPLHDIPLIDELIDDDRIPDRGTEIRHHHLPAFAEWQARLEAELGPWEDRTR